jgi:NAD(P)-dependent dehydrogenase (short-subunit alcohol dehydrogenase family)
MRSEHSAVPRHALVALLVRAEAAAAEGDVAKAGSLLSDLHWFAHDDGPLHQAMHRLELELARGRRDLVGVLGQLLQHAFARVVSFAESGGPTHEVVREVDAPPEVVYGAISDVASYSEWNPWCVHGEGSAERPGDEVAVDVKLGARKMRVRHRVLVAAPGERFGWYDLGWFTVLGGGRRLRWIERAGEGSRVVSRIKLYGPLAHLAWRLHGDSIRAGMAAEASALAGRAAKLAQSGSPAPVPSRSRVDKPLTGKTCVITGPTRGIGRPAALALGELGARVLLLCRSKDKGEALARELAARGAEGVVVPVDLASLASVEEAAARVRDLAPQIDVLLNNAGVLNFDRRLTVDGFEEGFGVNFLAHFLLTNRLLPALEAAPSARIVHVTSNSHPLVGRFDFADCNWERRRFRAFAAYAHSKLAVLLHNAGLARRLAGTRVCSVAVHPGIIATGMGTPPLLASVIDPLSRRIYPSPEEGSVPLVVLATSPAVAAHSGAYYSRTRLARPSRGARDDVAAERLFHLAETLLAERGFAAVDRAA